MELKNVYLPIQLSDLKAPVDKVVLSAPHDVQVFALVVSL